MALVTMTGTSITSVRRATLERRCDRREPGRARPGSALGDEGDQPD